MKRLACLLLMFAATLWFVACSPSSPSSSSETFGSLKIASTEHDFGEITRGEKANATFVLENVGSKPVTILNTMASCGCTAAVVSEKVIPPGKRGEIKVSFDTRGRQGLQKKTVRVETDDTTHPQITLTITGQVVVDLDFERPLVRFQPIRRGETQVRSMPIVLRKQDGLVFGEPTTDLKGLTAAVKREKSLDGEDRILLELTYTPAEVGIFSGRVKVPVNHPTKPELSLTVSAKVDGEISVIPARANLWRGQPNEAPSVVRLRSAEAPFKILSVTEPRGLLSVTTKAFESEKGYEVNITMKAEHRDHAEDFATEVTLKTDHPKMDTVVIPVSYSASAQKPRIGRPLDLKVIPSPAQGAIRQPRKIAEDPSGSPLKPAPIKALPPQGEE